jgi:hypothetical protein
MEELKNKLNDFIGTYLDVERNKNRIESETAYVITNAKYYENMRHSFGHLIRAIEFYVGNQPQNLELFREHFAQAKHHLQNLDVNGYEYLAGVFLEELRQKIESTGFFHSVGNANEFRRNALRQFDLGREKRTPDRVCAMKHFECCIQECKRGLHEIKPLTSVEKGNYRMTAGALLVAILSLGVAVIALYK